MYLKAPRVVAVNRALANTPLSPSCAELEILTRYVLGYLTLERTNELLYSQGRQLRLSGAESVAIA